MIEFIDLLSQIPLFAGSEPAEIPAMLNCLHAHKQHFAKNAFIRVEGDPADFIGIVLSGTIHILQDDYCGQRTIMASFSAGELFAEAVALMELSALPFSILSVTDTDILFIDVDRLLHQCGDGCAYHNRLIGNLLKIVAQKNMLLNQKLRCVTRKTTAEKLLAYLYEQARQQHANEFMIPFDRQGLADYLGVERSAMSAELSKLRKQGILETKRRWFRMKGDESMF